MEPRLESDQNCENNNTFRDFEIFFFFKSKIEILENYLPERGLQFLISTFFDKMYISCFNYKKHYWEKKFHILSKRCKLRNKC